MVSKHFAYNEEFVHLQVDLSSYQYLGALAQSDCGPTLGWPANQPKILILEHVKSIVESNPIYKWIDSFCYGLLD